MAILYDERETVTQVFTYRVDRAAAELRTQPVDTVYAHITFVNRVFKSVAFAPEITPEHGRAYWRVVGMVAEQITNLEERMRHKVAA